MGEKQETRLQGGAKERPVTYCLLPAELAPKLHDPLRLWFSEAPDVRVVVEQRHRDRRGLSDRRATRAKPPSSGERRRIPTPAGRRVAERRAEVARTKPLPLPRKARPLADEIIFFIRLEPTSQELEDLDTARVVARFQEGDREAYSILYARYFDRTYAYLRVLLKHREEAEDATQDVFANILAALPTYERREQPFRAWLFTAARNAAVDRLRKEGRIELMDPEEMERTLDENGEQAAGPGEAADANAPGKIEALDWITDPDLLIFVERLPIAQRRVLALRYLLDLTTAEIAQILDRKTADVRVLQSRALRVLNERLTAIGRAPQDTKSRDRQGIQRRFKQAPVLRLRRFMLGGPPPPGGRGY